MIQIKPFQTLRPMESYASQVVSVPYDTVDRSEAAVLALNNPLSFLHVIRSEIDLSSEIDPYTEAVYKKAADNLQFLQNRGILIRETEPCLYLYRLQKGSHSQQGIVACCHVDDYEKDIIKKHEKTRNEKETDRTRHIMQLNAHAEPVFLMYRDRPDIDQITQNIETEKPLYDLTLSDNVRHTIWKIRESQRIVQAFQAVQVCYIADGHHRAASAVRVANEIRASQPTRQKEYNWFLSILFPANQLRILPYNRSIRDLNGKTVQTYLEAVRSRFNVAANANPSPTQAGHISMYVGKKWYDLCVNFTGSTSDCIHSLDVDILQNHLLEPVLDIHDPKSDPRIEFIDGNQGPGELERRVDSGKAAVAFSMFPISVNQIMAVADDSQIMPPKSTWFAPKPRSGFLIHSF